MATEKIVNYTAEQTAKAVADYAAGATVEAIATSLGKTTRSVIAKLTKEGVYKSKAREVGKREMLKAEMVAEIATITGVNEEVLESLEKATGPALMAVLKALREAQ